MIAPSSPLVTLDEIRAAAGRIRGVAIRTPLLEIGLASAAVARSGAASRDTTHSGARHRSGGPSASADATADHRSLGRRSSGPPRLALKCENLQPMGAFKVRGACNMITQLTPEARGAGVITFSSGNHGQAVALVARHFGIPAVVVMPTTAPRLKIERVKGYGGDVILEGTTSMERKTRAEAEAARRGLTMIPPFDHPAIVAGAGTVGLEILDQYPAVAVVYVPVGGGGLIAGVSAAIRQMRPSVRVVGVEPAGAAKMSASLEAGHPVTLSRTGSIADGLLPVRPGDLTFAHVTAFVDRVVTVTDDAIVRGMQWLFSDARVVAEPSGAVAVAAALAGEGEPAVAIISGGNIAGEEFAKYLLTHEPETSDSKLQT